MRILNISEAIARYTMLSMDENIDPITRSEAKKVADILENACDHIFQRWQSMTNGPTAEYKRRGEFLKGIVEELDI